DWAEPSGIAPRQFAVTIDQLREHGFSNTHLSWLILNGFVEHLHEFTPPGDDERILRNASRSNFLKRSRFVLTSKGADFARPICQANDPTDEPTRSTKPAPHSTDGIRPRWDRKRLQLMLGDTKLMQLSNRARNLIRILDAFEEENWPPR